MEIVLFYIPFGTAAEASTAGHFAVEKQLAACANIFPIQSIFPWEGEIQKSQECVLLLKTIPSLKENLQTYITELHTYQTPAILSWTADVNEAYGAWMLEQLQQSLN